MPYNNYDDVIENARKILQQDSISDTKENEFEPATEEDLKRVTQQSLAKIKKHIEDERNIELTGEGLNSFDDLEGLDPVKTSPNIKQSDSNNKTGSIDVVDIEKNNKKTEDNKQSFVGKLKKVNHLDNEIAKALWGGVQKGISDFYKAVPGFSQSKFLREHFIEPGEKTYKNINKQSELPNVVKNFVTSLGSLAVDIPTSIGIGEATAAKVANKVSEKALQELAKHKFSIGTFIESVSKHAQNGDDLGKTFYDSAYETAQAMAYEGINGKLAKQAAQMMGLGATFAATDKAKNGETPTSDDVIEGALTGLATHIVFKTMDSVAKASKSASEKAALWYLKKKLKKKLDETLKNNENINEQRHILASDKTSTSPLPDKYPPKDITDSGDNPSQTDVNIIKDEISNSFKSQEEQIKDIVKKIMPDETQDVINDVANRAIEIASRKKELSNVFGQKETVEQIKNNIDSQLSKIENSEAPEPLNKQPEAIESKDKEEKPKMQENIKSESDDNGKTEQEPSIDTELPTEDTIEGATEDTTAKVDIDEILTPKKEKHRMPKIKEVDEIPEKIRKVKSLPRSVLSRVIRTSDGFIGGPTLIIDKKYANKTFKNIVESKIKEKEYDESSQKLIDIVEKYSKKQSVYPKNYVGYKDDGITKYIYKDHNNKYWAISKTDVDYVMRNIPNAEFVFPENWSNAVGVYTDEKLVGAIAQELMDENANVNVLKHEKEVVNEKKESADFAKNKGNEREGSKESVRNIQENDGSNDEGLPEKVLSGTKEREEISEPSKPIRNENDRRPTDSNGDREGGRGSETTGDRDNTTQLHNGDVSSKWSGYVLKDDDPVLTTPATRFDANLEAIEILKEHEKTAKPFTEEELEKLSKYSGFGGLNAIVNQKTSADYDRVLKLKKLLSDDEYSAVIGSAKDAFYTPHKVIQDAWNILDALGIYNTNRKLQALEPSAGIGRFIGFTPDNLKNKIKFTAIEKDKMTSQLISALYPNITVHNKGFEDTKYDNHFDLVIGNPPYGANFKITDEAYPELNRLNIHEYFAGKALESLKPGGIEIFFTSSNFLDHMSDKMLNYLDKHAYFIGALRYPEDTYKTTKVIADMVILRKLKDGEKSNVKEMIGGKGELNGTPINKYFAEHPDFVLGKDWSKGKVFNSLKSLDKNETANRIKKFLDTIRDDIFSKIENVKVNIIDYEDANPNYKPGVLYIENGKIFTNYIENETLQKEHIGKATELIENYVKLRDALNKLIDAEKNGDKNIEILRKGLNKAYDSFVKKHGNIRNLKNKIIENDKDYFSVISLEDSGLNKTAIFNKSTIAKQPKIKASSPKESVMLSILHKGKIDISFMAEITGKSVEDVLKDTLYKDIFYDPQDGYVPAYIYLSGDVKTKYNLTTDPKNKAALKKVFPKDKSIYDIGITIGADWIGKDIINEYAKERLGYNDWEDAVDREKNGTWKVTGNAYNEKFYTELKGQKFIFEKALNGVIVTSVKVPDGINPKIAVEEINSQIEALKEDFKDWVFSNSEIKKELEKRFNETQNRWVKEQESPYLKDYKIQNLDKDSFTPRPYQINATYKAVFRNKPILLNHVMGAGKSLTSAMIAMEWVRIGRAKKVMIITPKTSLEQYANDFKKAYPNAKVMIATAENFTAKRRKIFLSSIATSDVDVVVISHDNFGKIPQPKEMALQVLQQQQIDTQKAIENSKKGSRTAKQLSEKLAKIEQEIKALMKKKTDNVFSFDQLGIDGLIVDESHNFKSLYFPSKASRVKGMPTATSKKATDLYIKSRYILNMNNNFVMMTGTPLTNTIPEIYILQRYLQEDALRRQNIINYDDWAKQFTEITSDITFTPSGAFKVDTVLSKVINTDILAKMLSDISDTVTIGDLIETSEIKIPKLVDNKPTITYVERTEAQRAYMDKLAERIKDVESHLVEPDEDNHLKIYNDAKKASLDMRLIDETYSAEDSKKIDKLIQNVIKKYNEYKEHKGTQLIFCDIGVPKTNIEKKKLEDLIERAEKGDLKAEKILETKYSPAEIDDIMNGNSFNLYEDIKHRLASKGIPEDEIAFIHSYKTGKQKEQLSALVNDGKIRIVIGTRTKLGVGLNLQKRLAAIHQVDIPYRVDNIEQSNGRILRQGNKLLEMLPDFRAEIFYYSTKDTLDTHSWQLLERKAKAFRGIFQGKEIKDLGEETSGEMFEMLKAVTSGNPLLIEKFKTDKELSALRTSKRIFESQKQDLKEKAKRANAIIESEKKIEQQFKKIIEGVGDGKTIEINGKRYKEIKDASKVLVKKYEKEKYNYGKVIAKGKLGKSDFEIVTDIGGVHAIIIFNDKIDWGSKIGEFKIRPTAGAFTIKFNNIPNYFRKKYQAFKNSVDLARQTLDEWNRRKDEEFKDEKRLKELEAKSEDLKKKMQGVFNESPETPQEQGQEENNLVTGNKKIDELTTPKKSEDYLATDYKKAGEDVNRQPNNPDLYRLTAIPIHKAQSIVIDGVARPQPDKVIYVNDIKELYKKLVGDRFYHTNLNKEALGKYARIWGSINTKHLYETEILAHEIGHYFQFNSDAKDYFNSFINENEEIIKTYSYTDKDNLIVSEGFAELVRAYFTRHLDIDKNLYKELDNVFRKLGNKKYKLIKKIQEQSHFYFNQGIENLTESAIEPNKKFLDYLESFVYDLKDADKHITNYFDVIHPVKMIMKDLGKVDDLEKNNLYTIASNAIYGWRSTVEAFAKYGTGKRDKDGEIHYIGSSMGDVISSFFDNKFVTKQEANKRLNLLYKYLQLKQSIYQVEKQGKKSPFGSADYMRKEVERIEIENPQFKKAIPKWLKFNKDMLDFAVSSHLISEEMAKIFRKTNPLYMPQHRVVGRDEGGVGNSIKRRTKGGSERQLKNVANWFSQYENWIKMSNEAFVKYKIFSEIENSDKLSEWAQPIKKGTSQYKALIEQQVHHFIELLKGLELTIDKDGAIIDGNIEEVRNWAFEYLIEHPELITFYKGGGRPYSVDGTIVSIIDDKGEMKYFEINRNHRKGQLLLKMLDGIDASIPNLAPAFFIRNIVTRSIVGMPQFVLSNLIRDTGTAAVYSKANMIPIWDTAKGAYKFIKADDTYKQIILNGVSSATRAEGITEEGKKRQMMKQSMNEVSLNKAIDVYDKAVGVFEIANRMAEANKALKKTHSLQVAARAFSSVSVNFSRYGASKWFRTVGRTIPFFSAFINSLYKDFNEFTGNEVKIDRSRIKTLMALMLRGFFYISIPSLLLYLYTTSNKEREEKRANLQNYIGALNEPIIIGDKVYKLPESWIVGVAFSKAPEMALRVMTKKHGKKATEEFLLALKIAMTGTTMPAIIAPIYDLQTNKDFRGKEIVPYYLKGLSGEQSYLQYKSYTPLIYQKIAKEMRKVGVNISPIKIQYLFDNYFGYVAKAVEGISQKALWKEKEWGEMPYPNGIIEQTKKRFVYTDYGQGYYTEKYAKIYQKVKSIITAKNTAKFNKRYDRGESLKGISENDKIIKVTRMYKTFAGMRKAIGKSYKRDMMIIRNSHLNRNEKEKRLRAEAKFRDNLYKIMYLRYSKILEKE